MTKQNKILLGIGVAGIATYLYLMRRNKKFLFATGVQDAQVYFDECVATSSQLPSNAPADIQIDINAIKADCCAKISANLTRFNLSSATWNGTSCVFSEAGTGTGGTGGAGTASDECTRSGGIWNGQICTPCADATHMVYNGECKTDEEVKCITQQGGDWVNGVCVCPTNMTMQNGVCTATAIDATDTGGTGTGTGTTTTIVTPPPFFPGLSNLPTSDGSADSGGGGGATDETSDLFDWIPWILAGMTTALSVVSEQKQA